MPINESTKSRAKASARKLAMIADGITVPISLKSVVFFINMLFGAYWLSRVHHQYVMQRGSKSTQRAGRDSRHYTNAPPPPP
ncbi:hypothetical protein GGI12_002007, partial [Dipsacomyces acuminosporus]